ncbi:hypothetical protein E5D57_012820 [Metarhizium anisopliae]|nr:hypothetical protein E5D57_012820 [Metarhizium anisopliae]
MSLPGWRRDEESGAKVNSHSRQALAQIMLKVQAAQLYSTSIDVNMSGAFSHSAFGTAGAIKAESGRFTHYSPGL